MTDRAGRQVEVGFKTLTADDLDTLKRDDWQGARFIAVWKEWAGYEVALKLTRHEASDNSILGIVKVGNVEYHRGKPNLLRDSLLEASPSQRQSATERTYYGVGRVLVARLIRESQTAGAAGRLLVRPAQNVRQFYLRLGFEPVLDKKYYFLNTEKAEMILATYLPASLEGQTETD